MAIITIIVILITTSIPAVVNCGALNMRSGAGTNYSVVTTLTKNTAVTITGEAKDSSGTLWYKITAGSKTGYVHSSYLTKKNAGGNSSNNNNSDTSTDVSGQTMMWSMFEVEPVHLRAL